MSKKGWGEKFGGFCGKCLDLGFWDILTPIAIALTGYVGIAFTNYNFTEELKELTVSKFFSLDNPFPYLVLALILSIANIFGNIVVKNRLQTRANAAEVLAKSYKDERDNAQITLNDLMSVNRKLSVISLETWIKICSLALKLSIKHRISIYYESDGHLFLLARYSQTPKYNKKNRTKFPIGSDILSLAWQDGDFEAILPNFSKNPNGYIQHSTQKYGYTKEQVNDLTMKSGYYYGKAISNDNEHIGVIMFETEPCVQLDKELKDKLITQIEISHSLLANQINRYKESHHEEISHDTIEDEQEIMNHTKTSGRAT